MKEGMNIKHTQATTTCMVKASLLLVADSVLDMLGPFR